VCTHALLAMHDVAANPASRSTPACWRTAVRVLTMPCGDRLSCTLIGGCTTANLAVALDPKITWGAVTTSLGPFEMGNVCREAVQAAMDAEAASGTAFSKKRRRKGTVDDDSTRPADKKEESADSGNDDDEEDDDIPLKRPLARPAPAKQPQSKAATAVASQQPASGSAAKSARVESPPGEVEAEKTKASSTSDVKQPVCGRPPVATPKRPPVARGGPSRSLQASGDAG
jgi:hypothetical protein